MKISIAIFVLLFLSVALGKITIDDFMLDKNVKRKVSQLTYLQKAQERFAEFINCKIYADKKTEDEAKFAKCVNDHFVEPQSPVGLVNFSRWFNSESKLSLLFECPTALQSIAEKLKRNPKDIIYCFDAVENGTKANGFLYFQIKDEKLLLHRIKI